MDEIFAEKLQTIAENVPKVYKSGKEDGINEFAIQISQDKYHFGYMFCNCRTLTTIPPLKTSGGIYFNEMFYDCTNLITIPPLHTHNGVNFRQMFYGCKNLTTIPLLNLSNANDMANMFYGCESLENITFKGCIKYSLFLQQSSMLTVESVLSIVNALADLTRQDTKTLALHENVKAKLTEEIIETITAKNWTIA